MLLALLYQLVRYLTDLALVRTPSDAQLRAEVLALRHQLRVLERKVGKPAWQPGDRLLLAALSRLLRRSSLDAVLPRPETLLGWHRELVRRSGSGQARCSRAVGHPWRFRRRRPSPRPWRVRPFPARPHPTEHGVFRHPARGERVSAAAFPGRDQSG
ncbi:MAG TPA: hypothetical protein VKF14_20230 [Candidatus Dormibacteraeota bacterium]|nr:hypothetical protein [Candidatus Dormibacteraeota bacterium]